MRHYVIHVMLDLYLHNQKLDVDKILLQIVKYYKINLYNMVIN
jgi:hypothetical protein